jgi:hypothetical protein
MTRSEKPLKQIQAIHTVHILPAMLRVDSAPVPL